MPLIRCQAVAQQLDDIAAELHSVAQRSQRKALAERLARASAPLADTSVEIVVVGQFKKGKSALVNALTGAPVCPVDDVVATAVPTVVSWGEHPSAVLVTEITETPEHPDTTQGPSKPVPSRVLRTEIDPLQLRQHVVEQASESGILGNLRAEVTLPSPLLKGGVTLVDTPGVGRAQARAFTNLTLLPRADAAIMVSDATQELTEPELNFIHQARELCPRVSCVISKIDLQLQWREIASANADHLTEAAIETPIIATSALLHGLATEERDPMLRAESGIDELATHLTQDVRSEVISARQQMVANDICSVGEHLAMVVQAELRVLETGADGREVVQTLKETAATAKRLSQHSSRWQQTLSDGAMDLISDIEFDLRDRLRTVSREAEQLIDSSDPGEVWDDIGTWLAESVTQAVSDNFVWTHQRSVHLAEVVAEHFSLEGHAAVPTLSISGADHVLNAISGLEVLNSGRLTLGQKLMIGMKGSYGGVLMFGLMTTLAGMALVNPISIAAGLIMGGFSYRQEADQRLEQRRAAAKTATRKLIDESIFQVSKESRDHMGQVKRTLRDHFINVAEELKQSLNESLQAAQHSAELPPSEQTVRAEALAAELSTIHQLCAKAQDITAQHTTPPTERKTA